jgi:hypothetical protein
MIRPFSMSLIIPPGCNENSAVPLAPEGGVGQGRQVQLGGGPVEGAGDVVPLGAGEIV